MGEEILLFLLFDSWFLRVYLNVLLLFFCGT